MNDIIPQLGIYYRVRSHKNITTTNAKFNFKIYTF